MPGLVGLQVSLDLTERTGRPEPDIKDMTARTGRPSQDSRDRQIDWAVRI